MYQVLSTSNYNLLASENLGRKNIVNIGIPAGLVDTLAQQAFSKSNDDNYLDSTLIAIYLHRKNELTDEEEVFPRPFVFDTAKYVSNVNTTALSKLIPDLEYLNELAEGGFADGHGLNNAVSFSSFLLSDRNLPDAEKVSFYETEKGRNGIKYGYIDGSIAVGTNYEAGGGHLFQKDVSRNHVIDNCLKIYQNLMLDLEFESYNFLLENENLYTGQTDDSEIVNSCRQSFRNFLFAFYPSFNVDEVVRNRISKALTNYDNLIFNNLDSKLRQLTSGFVFDRVFSIPYSDRDFILKTDDYESVYGVDIPIIRATSVRQCKVESSRVITSPSKPVESNYTQKLNLQSSGTIYKFFATVCILKRW